MSALRRALLVAAGAAFGGFFRVTLAGLLPVAADDPSLVAPALLVVNVSGSLLAGFVRGLIGVAERTGRNLASLDAAMVVGFCGGYTSYSAFVALLHEGLVGAAPWSVGLAAATVVLCPLAAALGLQFSGGMRGGYPARPSVRSKKEPA